MVAKLQSNAARPLPDLPSLCLAITERAPLPMATLEGATRIVRYGNPAFCRLVGRKMKQFVGRPLDELLPKKDRCVILVDRVFRTRKPESYTEQEPAKPRPIFWSYTIWPVEADQGLVNLMIQVTETAAVHDSAVAMNQALLLGSLRQHELTEAAEKANGRLQAEIAVRVRAEDLLRQSEALFSALLDQAPIGVYVVDDELHLRQINPKALPVFRKIRPLLGRELATVMRLIWPRRIADEILRRFRHTLLTGEPHYATDFTERRRDTGMTESYEWQIQRIILPAGRQGVVCFFNDITERKRTDAAEQRTAVLTYANRQANLEIARRRAVEKTLLESEVVQRGLLVESQTLHVQLRHLTRGIITAQEDERKTISRELHDDVMQTLVGINVALAALTKGAEMDPVSLQVNIARTQRLVKEALNAVHRFARDLRPAVLDDFGLVPALQTYGKDLAAEKKLDIRFTAPRDLQALDHIQQTVLFRVAQEALSNVARHARARVVHLRLTRIPGAVRLEVQDDGKSFQVQTTLAPGKNKRLGLLGMRERVEMIGGTLVIQSTRCRGTLVRADIPLNREGAA